MTSLKKTVHFFLALLTISSFTLIWNAPALYKRIDMLDEEARMLVQPPFQLMEHVGLLHKLDLINDLVSETEPNEHQEALAALEVPVENKELPLNREGNAPIPTHHASATPPMDSAPLAVSTPPQQPPPHKSGTQLIAFVGDSFANGYAAAGKSTPLGYSSKDFGRHSTGLVVKSYYDWIGATEKICEQSKPAVFIFSFGANDPQDIKSDKGYLRFGSSDWKSEYAQRATKLVSIAHNCGAKAAWLALPPMREAGYEKKMDVIRLAQDEACQKSDACVPPPEEFSPCCQQFSSSGRIDGKNKLLRAADGIHRAYDGYLLSVKATYKMLNLEH